MAQQELFTCTNTKRNNYSIDSNTLLLNAGRIVSIETQNSGADTLIKYKDQNKNVDYFVTDNYSVVASYMGNYDSGNAFSINVLTKNGETWAKTIKINTNDVIKGWADASNAAYSHLVVDRTASGKAGKPFILKVSHTLAAILILANV